LTDRGTNFESHLFAHFCHLMGAQKARTTSFHAQCNGGTEVVNKVIKPCIAKLLNVNHEDWDVYLQMAVSSYNNSFHTSIGMTPFEAYFCRPGYLISDIVLNNPPDTAYRNVSDFTASLWENSQRVDNVIKGKLADAHAKQKLNYDKTVRDFREFSVGDSVKLVNFSKKIGQSSCFQDKFLGPFTIKKVVGETYTLEDIDGKAQTVHYNRILPFHVREQYMSEEPLFAPCIPRFAAAVAAEANSELSTLRRSSRVFAKLCAINKQKAATLISTRATTVASTVVHVNSPPVTHEDDSSSASPSENENEAEVDDMNTATHLISDDNDESVNVSSSGAPDNLAASSENNSDVLNTSRNVKGKTTFQCAGCNIISYIMNYL
jgi:hypothetical protein